MFAPSGDQIAAIKTAEKWVERHQPDSLALTKKTARWRRDVPSKKQLELCRKLYIPVPPGATKGDVSVALDRFFNRKKMRAKQPQPTA